MHAGELTSIKEDVAGPAAGADQEPKTRNVEIRPTGNPADVGLIQEDSIIEND